MCPRGSSTINMFSNSKMFERGVSIYIFCEIHNCSEARGGVVGCIGNKYLVAKGALSHSCKILWTPIFYPVKVFSFLLIKLGLHVKKLGLQHQNHSNSKKMSHRATECDILWEVGLSKRIGLFLIWKICHVKVFQATGDNYQLNWGK